MYSTYRFFEDFDEINSSLAKLLKIEATEDAKQAWKFAKENKNKLLAAKLFSTGILLDKLINRKKHK